MGESVREKEAASGSVGLAGARWGVEDIYYFLSPFLPTVGST